MLFKVVAAVILNILLELLPLIVCPLPSIVIALLITTPSGNLSPSIEAMYAKSYGNSKVPPALVLLINLCKSVKVPVTFLRILVLVSNFSSFALVTFTR